MSKEKFVNELKYTREQKEVIIAAKELVEEAIKENIHLGLTLSAINSADNLLHNDHRHRYLRDQWHKEFKIPKHRKMTAEDIVDLAHIEIGD